MELLLALVICFIPFAILFGLMSVYFKIVDKRSRLPFDYSEMGRIPGFSLLKCHRDQTLDLTMYAILAAIYVQMPFSFYAISQYFELETNAALWWFYIALCWSASAYSIYRSFSAFKEARNTRLGIEAEWAVSNSLAQIRDANVRVFHDIQGPNFNIDHVLTHPGGVIAIETKERRKPNHNDAKHTHKVEVSGNKLVFPHYSETATIDQAIRQAKWLSEELTSSTGMSLHARPMVVIPGWFVELKNKPIVPVMNNKTLVSPNSDNKCTTHG